MVLKSSFVPITLFPDNINELKTIVFIDYESLFWGLFNKYGETPDLNSFINELKKRGRIERIKVFGDFKGEMEEELSKIRTITNEITNCSTNRNKETKKEFTDFIMLDHIYQTIFNQPEIEQYILVTGDGHFHSVATFLRTFKDKVVGIFGVFGSLSPQLVNCSTWGIEIKPQNNTQNHYQAKVLKTILWAEQQNHKPTFRKTVEVASKYYRVEQAKFTASLSKLIESGYIKQEEETTPKGITIPVLIADWSLINKHNLLDEDV